MLRLGATFSLYLAITAYLSKKAEMLELTNLSFYKSLVPAHLLGFLTEEHEALAALAPPERLPQVCRVVEPEGNHQPIFGVFNVGNIGEVDPRLFESHPLIRVLSA